MFCCFFFLILAFCVYFILFICIHYFLKCMQFCCVASSFFIFMFFVFCSLLSIQKVPERVATSLNIPKKGLACVRLSSGEAKTRVEYSTSTDGRIAFNKKQWRRFLSKTTLEINDCIFMFFKASSKSCMNVTVVVSKL